MLSTSVETKIFNEPLPQSVLNIDAKNRSNLFTWRGQFSPQLIEGLLRAYCFPGATILDPFAGSGTALYEAGCLGMSAYGFELNPSAWIISKIYQFINVDILKREKILASVKQKIQNFFPEPEILSIGVAAIELDDLSITLPYLKAKCSPEEIAIIDALIIILDLYNKSLNTNMIYAYLHKLSKLILLLPYSNSTIVSHQADSRHLPLHGRMIDFVVTSPPYINVFNYHQNYRKSAEILGWDLLKIAKSEIGSNRANRGNRFLTVIQYCLDMLGTLCELSRVCAVDSRLIFIVGHESNVLGVPFYNSFIIESMIKELPVFHLVQLQKREFKNKYGQIIREDLLHFISSGETSDFEKVVDIGRAAAKKALTTGLAVVSEKNRNTLLDAIERIDSISGTPIFRSTIKPTNIFGSEVR